MKKLKDGVYKVPEEDLKRIRANQKKREKRAKARHKSRSGSSQTRGFDYYENMEV